MFLNYLHILRFRSPSTILFVILLSLNYLPKDTNAATLVQGACSYLTESKKCIDSTPCKLDTSGVLVCLAGIELSNGGVPSRSNPLGSLSVSQTCWQYSFDFACSNALDSSGTQALPVSPNPGQPQDLGSSLTSALGLTPAHNGCAVNQSDSSCSLVNSLCSSQILNEFGELRCAQYQQTYSCLDRTSLSSSPSSVNFNQSVVNPSPTLCKTPILQSSALSLGGKGSVVSTASTSIALTTTLNRSNSFVQAAIAMEVANEIQTYSSCSGTNSSACVEKPLFGGVRESCTKGWLGLKNCCKAQPGAKTNSAMLGMVLGPVASTIKYAGERAVDSASPYVFDAMYANGAYTQGMISAITHNASVITDSEGFAQATILSSNSLNIGALGFNFGVGTAPVGGGLFGATTELVPLSSVSQGYYVSFNPYVFAGTMALTVIEEMGQCSRDETLLAMHRGQSLSVYVDEVCSESISLTNTCIAYTDDYCSFNGVLGKIINQQGKNQLGTEFASCTGLSIEQIAKIDFTKIDFSEFTGLLSQQVKNNIPQNINGNYLTIESNRKQGSIQRITDGTGYLASDPAFNKNSSIQDTPASP